MKRTAISGVFILVGAAIFYYFAVQKSDSGIQGAFEIPGTPAYVSTILMVLSGFMIMVVGVALGALYRLLIQMKSTGQQSSAWSVIIKQAFHSLDFQIGLVGSPIVFGLLWQGISDLGMAQFLVIALQNGFTVHAVLGRIVEPAAPSASNSQDR